MLLLRKGLNNKKEVKIVMYISWYLSFSWCYVPLSTAPMCSKVDGWVFLRQCGKSLASRTFC